MNIFRDPVLLIACGFGAGLSPKAPGTFGTLIAVPLYLVLESLGLSIYLIVLVVASVGGIRICSIASRKFGMHDCQQIVWDEIVGYWITMAAFPVSPENMVVGFLLFRVYDIFKPWPIRVIDRSVGGGLGIMLDDILAGIFGWISLYALIAVGWVG